MTGGSHGVAAAATGGEWRAANQWRWQPAVAPVDSHRCGGGWRRDNGRRREDGGQPWPDGAGVAVGGQWRAGVWWLDGQTLA